MIRLNCCFVENVLPAVFEVENDLNDIGYWNQLNIGRSTSLESGKPNIREVGLYFYPEKSEQLPARHRTIETTYKAVIRASRDFRKLTFSFWIPKRIPRIVDNENHSHTIENIDTAVIDDFLETFVKGALAA